MNQQESIEFIAEEIRKLPGVASLESEETAYTRSPYKLTMEDGTKTDLVITLRDFDHISHFIIKCGLDEYKKRPTWGKVGLKYKQWVKTGEGINDREEIYDGTIDRNKMEEVIAKGVAKQKVEDEAQKVWERSRQRRRERWAALTPALEAEGFGCDPKHGDAEKMVGCLIGKADSDGISIQPRIGTTLITFPPEMAMEASEFLNAVQGLIDDAENEISLAKFEQHANVGNG